MVKKYQKSFFKIFEKFFSLAFDLHLHAYQKRIFQILFFEEFLFFYRIDLTSSSVAKQ